MPCAHQILFSMSPTVSCKSEDLFLLSGPGAGGEQLKEPAKPLKAGRHGTGERLVIKYRDHSTLNRCKQALSVLWQRVQIVWVSYPSAESWFARGVLRILV